MHKIRNNTRRSGAEIFKPRLLSLLIMSALAPSVLRATPVNELPSGGQIVSGVGAISQSGNVLAIQQQSARLVSDWQSFNVGQQATVNIQQQVSDLFFANVHSGNASQIHGQINAAGNVIIANPAGVLFGSSARVDVGGLVAAGQHVDAAEAAAGRLQLKELGAGGQVINQGQIHTRPGGYVILAGQQVRNEGDIQSPQGTIGLLAGDRVRMELSAGGLIGIQVDGQLDSATIDNSGVLLADGGRILMDSQRAGRALGAAINQQGLVRADSLSLDRQGKIVLDGAQGDVLLSGTLSARGVSADQSGGQVSVTGAQVSVSGQVDVSGAAGGGLIEIGGGWQGQSADIAEATEVHLSAAGDLRADALRAGDGGEVVLWSTELTTHAGRISARGAGSGRGGDVETSSRGALGVSGSVDASASSGLHGRWLLDPDNINVVTPGGVVWGTGNSSAGDVSVSNTSIQDSLNAGTNVSLQATQDITIGANISKTAGADASLTFDAGNDVTLNTGIDISSTTGRLDLSFGTAANNAGTAFINGRLATNGGAVNFHKEAQMGASNPVSTQITGTVSGTGPYASGNITFHQDMLLAAGDGNVSIDSQGQSDGGYIGTGGAIDIRGDIYSVAAQGQALRPQALTIDTRGSTPGAITLGTDADNSVGGSGQAALRQLNFRGPQSIALNASTINLLSTSGAVITANSTLGDPELKLNAQDTVINVRGGTVSGTTGYTDYLQDTFSILGSAQAESLVINADRSIKVLNQNINADSNQAMDVYLNPFVQKDAAPGGGVIMLEAELHSNGGDIYLGGASDQQHANVVNNADDDRYAVGFAGDSDSRTDGVFLQNVELDSRSSGSDGLINISGRAPLATSAGAGVRISGASTRLESGDNNLLITGRVTTQTNAGNKDAVIIGEGSAARSLLATEGGNLRIVADASSVTNPSGGTRYNGLMLSSGVLLRSGSGDISLVGRGGGGDQNFIQENHGIRMEDLNTSIVSSSGNILIEGRSGGKTSDQGENSFGIYAAGNAMYIGRDQNRSQASGDILFVADAMEFVNTSDQRLQVSSSGHLAIRPENASTSIHFGSAGSRPARDGIKTLYLGEDWFNGSAVGIFQPSPVVTATEVESGIQQLAIQGNSGGSFTLRLGEKETSTISYSSDLNQLRDRVESALKQLSGFESVTVTTSGSNLRVNVGSAQTELMTAGGQVSGFSNIAIGRQDLSGQIVVNAPTTFRDDVTFMSGSHRAGFNANLVINSALTVQRQPNRNAGGRLAFWSDAEDQRALVAKGLITADRLYQFGKGDSVLSAGNRINQMAAEFAGDLTLRNNQQLEIGSVSASWLEDYTWNAQGELNTTPETSTLNGITLDGDQLDILLDTGDVRMRNDISVLEGTVSLETGNGRIIQTNNALIEAEHLWLAANSGTSALHSSNRVDTLTGLFSEGANLEFHNAQTLTLDAMTLRRRSADVADSSQEGQINSTDLARAGLLAGLGDGGGTLALRVSAGDILQTETETASRLRAERTLLLSEQGSIDMNNRTNQMATVSARSASADNDVRLYNAGALTLGRVDGVATALVGNSGAQEGVMTGRNGDIQVATVAGGLSLARSVSSSGTGNIDLRAGGANSDLSFSPDTGVTAAVRTDSGTVQLVAGQRIVTEMATAAQGEVFTSGSVALSAGGDIGSEQQRIELANSTALAARSGSGQLWLRRLGNTSFAVDQVAALNADSSVGGAVTALAGLTTSGGNGSITLTSSGGNLSVNRDINANGSGYVDLRTAHSGAIAINNGASVQSSTGALQLRAGGSISTNTNTGSGVELATAGGVRLTSGGEIGAADRRVEIASADVLTTRSSGDQYLAHSGVPLTIGSIAGVNADSTLDGGIGALSGMTVTGSGHLDLAVAESLHIAQTLSSNGDKGSIHVAAAAVTQDLSSASRLLTDHLSLRASSGDLRLDNPFNEVALLAVEGAGQLSMTVSGDLSTGSTDHLSGIRTQGDITLRSVSGHLTLAEGVVSSMAADGTLSLVAEQGGILAEEAAVQAARLRILSGDDVILSHDNNRIGQVAAELLSEGAAFRLHNEHALAVTEVSTVLGDEAALGSTAGIRSRGGEIALQLAAGDLSIEQTLTTGGRESGRILLDTAQGSIRAPGALETATLAVRGAGDALLGEGNQVAALAADIGGRFDFAGTGSVTVAEGFALSGLRAGSVSLRSGGDINLEQAIVATGNEARTVVLSASGAFHNVTGLGAEAIRVAEGDWLIYEPSVSGFFERLAGLNPEFSIFATSYERLGPALVDAPGNGYLVGTRLLVPDHYLRVNGGSSGESTVSSGFPLMDQAAYTASLSALMDTSATVATEAEASFGRPFPILPNADGSPQVTSLAQGARTLAAPLVVSVRPGSPFQTPLARLVGDAELLSVTQADGSPLPEGLSVRGRGMSLRLSGTLSARTTPLVLRLAMKNDSTGETQYLDIEIGTQSPVQTTAMVN